MLCKGKKKQIVEAPYDYILDERLLNFWKGQLKKFTNYITLTCQNVCISHPFKIFTFILLSIKDVYATERKALIEIVMLPCILLTKI